MPIRVVELNQGTTFTRSSEGGVLSDRAQRVFKVLLNSPQESWAIETAVGVKIGDPFNADNPIPCISLEARADGDSRVARIVTATYSSTPGAADGAGGGNDPRRSAPDVRPAMYSLSTSLQQVPSTGGMMYDTGGWTGPTAFRNSAGDLLEGITKLEPVVTITIDQYSFSDQAGLLGYCGYVNSDNFLFSGHTLAAHTVMLQGISVRPHVEQFGNSTFRGFMVSFQFAYRTNYCADVLGQNKIIGWDNTAIDSGYNIINQGVVAGDVEQEHLNLKHVNGVLPASRVDWDLERGTYGEKCRARIIVGNTEEGGAVQRPAAQPVLLNPDGSPRSRSLKPRVFRLQTQPEMAFGNNFSNFGIRGFT